jgi:hypothetical protein
MLLPLGEAVPATILSFLSHQYLYIHCTLLILHGPKLCLLTLLLCSFVGGRYSARIVRRGSTGNRAPAAPPPAPLPLPPPPAPPLSKPLARRRALNKI